MKLSKSDFPLLRRSLLALAASAIFSATMVYISSEYAGKADRELHSARSMDNDTRRSLAAAREDQESMAIYADEYGVLLTRKIIGDDHRLDWIEGMEMIRQMNLVTDFRYSIAPQKNYAPQPPLDSGNFDIHYSETKLSLDLLHEAQLIDFFAALHKSIKGWYQLEGCTLQRSAIETENSTPVTATQIKAECIGGWVTLKNRNAQS